MRASQNRPSEGHDARRGKLLQGLFWGGLGLAPLALLILLFGSSTGSVRVAAILAVLTVVMLALSVALRPSVEMFRVDIEHRVLDEVERIRAHSREDVTTAARNTHRALSEKIRTLTETIELLREQLDEVQAGAMLAQPAVSGGGAHSEQPGVVRRTETVHVTRRTTTVGSDGKGGGTVYGSPVAIEGGWQNRPTSPPVEDRYDDRRHEEHRPESRPSDGRRDDQRHDDHRHESRHGDGRPERARHDEWAARGDDRSRRDDDWAPHRDDHREPYRDDRRSDHRADDDYRGSRRDDRDDDRRRASRRDGGRDDRDDDRHRASRRDEGRDDRPDDRRDDRYDDRRDDRRDDDHGRWEASGDRWASVRTDDRGRELRIGERRSSVRSDDRGTEYRVEDRWAALRRDDEPGDPDWDALRSLSAGGRGPVAALPAARGETVGRYLDEESDPYGVPRSRGRVREAERGRERSHDGYDRGRQHDDDRDRDRDRDIPRPRGSYDDYR